MVLGTTCLSAFAQGTITQTEPDDSIGTANATGFTAGSSGIKVAYGNNGDGAYGPNGGNDTGDMDFYKVSANAGQVITVQLKNYSTSDDFDGLLGLYSFSGGTATLLAINDDLSGGVSRGSGLTFTAPATSDYYICVSNWIDAPDQTEGFPGSGSLPTDPLTPGTGLGTPGGTAGPYQLIVGLDYNAPVPQFDGTGRANPTPPLNPVKLLGTSYRTSNLKISNTGNADYTVTGFTITGADAARFSTYGLGTPLTIPAGGSRTVKVNINTAGAPAELNAVIDFTSNDPLDLSYPIKVQFDGPQFNSPVTGGGTFTVKQVSATATTINTIELADQLLDGTIAGTAYTANVPVVNLGTGADGHFSADSNFPIGATPGDNFALQVTGTFTIKEEGEYTFLGYSDDGQRLKIDGVEQYSHNDYNTDHFATMTLSAGAHTLEFTMFEGGGGNSAELLIARVPGTFAAFGEVSWELLEATGPDTDGDGIADYLETAVGTNPIVADATADLDNDGLSNLGEILAGTGVNNPDTDSDSLKDGVETNTGVWLGLANTGTNPVRADSDSDGLADNVENPDLPSSSVTQPGTDPNKNDTDSDTFTDYAEIAFGTNPKDAASKPVINYQPVVSEDFEAPRPHSEYTFNSLNAAPPFEAGVYESDVPSHGSVARLTDNVGGSHNSVSFDYVDLTPGAVVQLSFDFRISATDINNAADGFGIGFFRKSAYGSLGTSPAIVNGKAWENPTGGGGYPNALLIGVGVYGGDTVRLIGPAAPTTVLATYEPQSTFVTPLGGASNPYSRAVITIVSNSPTSSVVSMDIIRDVDGAATRETVFTNVLVPDFQIKTEQLRLIAGARTGAVMSQVELDNLKYSVLVQSTPTLALSNTTKDFLADFYDGSGGAVNPSTLTVRLNGSPVSVTPTKTGNRTTVSYTGPAGSFFPSGTNTLVFSYTTTTGTPVTETRTFDPGTYTILPASLVLPAGSAGVPGFKVRTVQMDPIVVGTAATPEIQTTPNSLDYMEGILYGVTGTPFNGGNVADPSGAVNGIYYSDVINFEQESGAAGFFSGETTVPGIPGTTGTTDNYVFEALTWVNFPERGVYSFGVVADDGFRVSYGHAPVPGLSIVAPAASARIVPWLPSINGSQIGGVGAPYPAVPVTAGVIMAEPANAVNPAAPTTGLLSNAAAAAGKIVLIDRGVISFVAKIRAAQAAGAVAAIIINETNPDRVPAGLGTDNSDLSTITIPAGMISKGDGDKLKALIAGGLQLKLGTDNTTTIGKADLNQTTYFSAAVPVAGLYPIRFFNFEGGGGANAEWFSIDSAGVKHLVNDPNDESALKAYSTVLAGTAPTISLSSSGGSVVITFTGTLQSSTDLQTFTTVQGATSPYTVPGGSPTRLFFRAAQ
ncbi:MAG: hypothetical protein JWM59_4031 [Verrucomicrobiales bacterium]|nr:hypothetical protein [Verrucomicrobiales bacterium]